MKLRRVLARLGFALLVLLLFAIGFGVARFHLKASRQHVILPREFRVEARPAQLSRGKHLVETLGGCTECHGANLAGRVMDENPMLRLVAPNITRGRGGVVASYSDVDWMHAILHGVAPDGRNLAVMPSKELRTFSDQDVMAMIAYVRSVPAVDATPPTTRVSMLGKIMLGLAGKELWSANSIAHDEPRAGRATPSGATAAHGEYLIGVCKGCHGPNLKGGLKHGPDAPPSADISAPAMASWSREQLERLLRTGKRRDGTEISSAMPWRAMSQVTDEELTAMWLALRD